jgi:hypothetical protein
MDERRSTLGFYLNCGLDTLETVRRHGIYQALRNQDKDSVAY